MAWESHSCCWLSSCPVQTRRGSHSPLTCAAVPTRNPPARQPRRDPPAQPGLSLPPASGPLPAPEAPRGWKGARERQPFLVAGGKGGNEHLHGGICTITRPGSKPGPPAGKSRCRLAAGNLPRPTATLPRLPPRAPASCAGPKHVPWLCREGCLAGCWCGLSPHVSRDCLPRWGGGLGAPCVLRAGRGGAGLAPGPVGAGRCWQCCLERWDGRRGTCG